MRRDPSPGIAVLPIYHSPDRMVDGEIKEIMLESMAIIRSKDYNDSFLYAKIKDVVDLVLQVRMKAPGLATC